MRPFVALEHSSDTYFVQITSCSVWVNIWLIFHSWVLISLGHFRFPCGVPYVTLSRLIYNVYSLSSEIRGWHNHRTLQLDGCLRLRNLNTSCELLFRLLTFTSKSLLVIEKPVSLAFSIFSILKQGLISQPDTDTGNLWNWHILVGMVLIPSGTPWKK